MPRILVEGSLAWLEDALGAEGIAVTSVARGRMARALRCCDSDTALVLMVEDAPTSPPARDLRIARVRRRTRLPLVLLTLDADAEQRAHALLGGADDVIDSDAPPAEIVARLRSRLRRAALDRHDPDLPLRAGPLRINVLGRHVYCDDVEIRLSDAEFEILRVLAARPGRVCSRQELLGHLGSEASFRSIDVHVVHLRQKLGRHRPAGRIIETVRGRGYRLAAGAAGNRLERALDPGVLDDGRDRRRRVRG
jgi:DNA-binding response OmpR family regulator